MLNAEGEKLYGTVLPVDSNDTRITHMVVRPSKYYTFFISDSFGDGLCCDWGDGYFKLIKFNYFPGNSKQITEKEIFL